MDFHTCGAPCHGELVCVLNPEVGRACPTTLDGHRTEMNLDPVTSGIAVPATFVCSRSEAQSLIVRHRGVEVMDWENRRNPLQGAHGIALHSARARCSGHGGRAPDSGIPGCANEP